MKGIRLPLAALASLFALEMRAEPPIGRFVGVRPVPGLESTYLDESPTVSADGTMVYFASAGRDEEFGPATNLGPLVNVNSSDHE
jgi:hypothetical protein